MNNPSSNNRLPYPDLPVRSEAPQNSERRDPRRDQRETRDPRQGAMPQRPPSMGTRQTVLDQHSTFNGTYSSESDFLVEGTFEGEIDCKGTVTVAEGANVSATIQARNVVVAGAANGEVSCEERFTILSTGEMRGKAQAATLLVEEGAYFEGEFKMGGITGAGGFSSWQDRQPKNGRTRDSKNDAPSEATQPERLKADEKKAEEKKAEGKKAEEETPQAKS